MTLTQSEAAPAKGETAAVPVPNWFASYPAGVPKSIDPDAYPSLSAMLIAACRQHAERPAFECLSARMSYAEWERDSRDFAAFLVEEANCRPGDRVAIMLPNMLAYPVTFLGTLRAGLIVVNVNPLYTPRELQQQLADSGAEIIVIMENFAHKLQDVIAATKIRHVVVARLGDFVPMLKRWAFNFANSYLGRARAGLAVSKNSRCCRMRAIGRRASAIRTRRSSGSDVALLQYTGGTTGVAKGAMLTHRNLIANTLQCLAWTGRRRRCRERAGAHPAAALSYLLADREPVGFCGARRIELSHSRSARSAPAHSHHARCKNHLDVRRQYAVQCTDQHARIRRIGFQRLARRGRRRRGRAKRGGEPLARDHGQRVGRRLRLDRGIARRMHQSVSRSEDRHGRSAGAVDRSNRPRRCRQSACRRRGRRSVGARPAGDEGLLATARRNGAGPYRRRLAARPAISARSTRTDSCGCSTERRT